MPNLDPQYLNLDEVLSTEDLDRFYDEWKRVGDYPKAEALATKALVALGFTVGAWWTGEGDSFGPLSRCATVLSIDGVSKTIVYG